MYNDSAGAKRKAPEREPFSQSRSGKGGDLGETNPQHVSSASQDREDNPGGYPSEFAVL